MIDSSTIVLISSRATSVFSSLTIDNFRRFKRFVVDDLARVNLFVGENNAGKTSILEAAELLAAGSVRALFRSSSRRDETLAPKAVDSTAPSRLEIDLSHLFFGHELHVGSRFRITGDGAHPEYVECKVMAPEADSDVEVARGRVQTLENVETVFELVFASSAHPSPVRFGLAASGGVLFDTRRRIQLSAPEFLRPVHFLGTYQLEPIHLAYLWDSIVLSPEEGRVTEALQIIEPRLERIAFLSETPNRAGRGIVVKLSDSEQRLPLGSVGDGIKRLLALALNLLPSRGGMLLVDEIDTGLHYSVMPQMWRVVIETARQLEVQVLATTHSLDCVRALAWVHANEEVPSDAVAVHRIEKDADRSVRYSLREIALAAEHHVEVR